MFNDIKRSWAIFFVPFSSTCLPLPNFRVLACFAHYTILQTSLNRGSQSVTTLYYGVKGRNPAFESRSASVRLSVEPFKSRCNTYDFGMPHFEGSYTRTFRHWSLLPTTTWPLKTGNFREGRNKIVAPWTGHNGFWEAVDLIIGRKYISSIDVFPYHKPTWATKINIGMLRWMRWCMYAF